MSVLQPSIHQIHLATFLKSHPGPYSCRSGSNGVDDTYDVFCLTTERHIVSTHYWEEEEDARRIAGVVAAALNYYAGWHGLDERDLNDNLAYFRRHYPGPHQVHRGLCPMYGPFHEIRCQATSDTVLICPDDGSPSHVRRVAKVITRALQLLVQARPVPCTTIRQGLPVAQTIFGRIQ